MKKSSFSALLVAGVIAGGLVTVNQAFAYGAGDIYTRVGIAKVAPKDSNGSLADGTIDVDVKNELGLAFTLGYRFHDKLGVELLAALPFEHEIDLDAAGTDINASTKHLPPTLTLQYYPLGGTDARVQPYLGAGINYTRFSDEEIGIDGAELELDSSWGAAGLIGVDLLINDNWALNAAAWYLDIDTDASLGGNDLGTVNIDPIVVMGGISYRF
ncbi:OmpW/AlkL family protein [Litchfieldella xinjiangensis]|uniref:OmpW/AlkL family protein n=1 Tax=Litchfieldella xinjiangensis TaxID=1166948 RepID=UPI0005BA2E98|nr:OmpW family outer membrane protein [Halomonas xinjiangensis]